MCRARWVRLAAGARPARGGEITIPRGRSTRGGTPRGGSAPDHGVPSRAEVRGVHEHPLCPRTGVTTTRVSRRAAQFAVLAVECKDNVYLARSRLPATEGCLPLLIPAARLPGTTPYRGTHIVTSSEPGRRTMTQKPHTPTSHEAFRTTASTVLATTGAWLRTRTQSRCTRSKFTCPDHTRT